MHHSVGHKRQTTQRPSAYRAVATAVAAGGALLIALALVPGALALAAPPDGPPGIGRSDEANRGAQVVAHGDDRAPGRAQRAVSQPSASDAATEDDEATTDEEDATAGDGPTSTDEDAATDSDDRATPGSDAADGDDPAGDEDQVSDRTPGDSGQGEACTGDLEVRIVDVEGDLRDGGRIDLDDDADEFDGTYVIPDGLRIFSGLPCVTVAVSLADPPEGTVLAAREATEKLVTIESERSAAVEFAVEEAASTPPESDADAIPSDTATDAEERGDDVADVLPSGPRDRTVGDGAALADPARHPRTGVGVGGLVALGVSALASGGALVRHRGD